MKAKYFYLCCMLMAFSTHFMLAQEPTVVLKQAFEKCRRIQNGYYEMWHYQKFMTEADTLPGFYSCHFKKIPTDTLVGFYFHNRQTVAHAKANFTSEQVYNDKELAYTLSQDTSINVMTVEKWAKTVKNYSIGYDFYPLLTNPERSFINYNQEKWKAPVEFIKSETINGVMCRHVRISIAEEPNPKETISALRTNYDFWIAETDSMPVQYDITYKLLMGPDTVWQYDRYQLVSYELNKIANNDSLFSIAGMPANHKIKEYVPYEAPELLKTGTAAPLWGLPTLADKQLRLEDLKGKLVLMDFFYKSCYPCMQALPKLQELHEKYKDKGLQIVGINPVDKDAKELAEFLRKRNVSYTIAMDSTYETAKSYRISAYPTVYLLDKSGNIVFVEVGYGEDSGEKLEKIILQYL